MDYYFSSSKDPQNLKHPELEKQTDKVLSGPKYSIYRTPTWTKGLKVVFGKAKTPKFNIGESVKIEGYKTKIKTIKPVIINNDWTFKYVFENGKYRLEDQLE